MGLERLGYAPTAGQLAQLDRFLREIDLWNPRLKLVAAAGAELIVRHVLDSLAGPPAIRRLHGSRWPSRGRITDLGSGAGFPGIPIAIMEPDTRVDLVERSARRAGFLRNAIAAVGLPNAGVHECPLEGYGEAADLAVYRALGPLTPQLLGSMRRIVGDGGLIAAYKGRRARIESELEELRRAGVERGFTPWIVPVDVPFLDEERHLLLIARHATAA